MLRQIAIRLCSRNAAAPIKHKEFTITKRFTQNDLDRFAQVTGDHNPIHSCATPLEQRKVHGALLNAVVAGIIGTQLPGPGTVVLEQSFRFPKACRIEVDAEFRVRLLKERKISLVAYECLQLGEVVFEGEAKLRTKN